MKTILGIAIIVVLCVVSGVFGYFVGISRKSKTVTFVDCDNGSFWTGHPDHPCGVPTVEAKGTVTLPDVTGTITSQLLVDGQPITLRQGECLKIESKGDHYKTSKCPNGETFWGHGDSIWSAPK